MLRTGLKLSFVQLVFRLTIYESIFLAVKLKTMQSKFPVIAS